MLKNNTFIRSLLALCILLLLIIVAIGSFHLGLRQQEQKVQQLQEERATRENDYAKSLQTVSDQRNRALNDYQTSCYEYQKLRASYEELYKKVGASSGLLHYTFPDDARGNEESCYRL